MKLFSIHLYLVYIFSLIDGQSLENSECSWQDPGDKITPEIFWINMDKSIDRRINLQNHLEQVKLPHRRVKGLSLDNIYFPEDIRTTWDRYVAKIQTEEFIPHRRRAKINVKRKNYTHVMVGLYGRSKKNKLKEIGCTSSHLEAMRQAIYENKTTSRYALITEDDIQIPFNIDFDGLVASAPDDFGILQLFNSNEGSMESTWLRYIKSGHLWTASVQQQAASFWSTCAYLIDREVMKPIIDKIAYVENGWVYLKIIAGINKPCRPKLTSCCEFQNESMTFRFVDTPPCVWAAKGFQADSFIYATTKTYVLGSPLITNSVGGNQSTFHQDHVESIHQSAFARQRQYINEMISGKHQPPSFVTRACKKPLPITMTLEKRPPCLYPDKLSDTTIAPIYWVNQAEHEQQRVNMKQYLDQFLKRPNRRVEGITVQDLWLPADVRGAWQQRECVFHSSAVQAVPMIGGFQKEGVEDYEGVRNVQLIQINEEFPENIIPKAILSGLCGRGKGHNDMGDLSITVSHLKAIYEAVFLNQSSSPYALIIEDDVLIAFDLDIEELAESAPEDFGLLRLFTSHEQLMERHWVKYVRNNTDYWSPLPTERFYDAWSTKAYIINRKVLKESLQRVMREVLIEVEDPDTSRNQKKLGPDLIKPEESVTKFQKSLEFKVIAGLHNPCLPKECCKIITGKKLVFEEKPPCIRSIMGFLAQRFLWKLAPTYVLNIPVVTSAVNGIDSVFQGEKVEQFQILALKRQKQYINDLISGQVNVPSFAKMSCNRAIS